MSDNEDWRRELAERLHPSTDWTVRPMPRRPAAPIAQMVPLQEPNIAPPLSMASPESDVSVPADRATATIYPRLAPGVAEAARMPDERIWPYVVAALALLAAAAGWLFVNRVEQSPVAPEIAQVATAPASSAASVRLASLPADDAMRCNATLAAPALSALVRRETAFGGQDLHATTPATLSAVRQLTADSSTAVCRGLLELQFANIHAGSPATLQIVSGPVDFAVDGGVGASVPTFRLLRARSIIHRLATMRPPASVADSAAASVATVPPPVKVEGVRPIGVTPATMPGTVLRAPVRPVVAGPLSPQGTGAALAALPATAEITSPKVAEIEAARSSASAADATLEAASQPDERATDSAAAQASYAAIARSGDEQAIEAADEGSDLYLRQSRRCSTPACAAFAYKRWLTRLREIEERSSGNVN